MLQVFFFGLTKDDDVVQIAHCETAAAHQHLVDQQLEIGWDLTESKWCTFELQFSHLDDKR